VAVRLLVAVAAAGKAKNGMQFAFLIFVFFYGVCLQLDYTTTVRSLDAFILTCYSCTRELA